MSTLSVLDVAKYFTEINSQVSDQSLDKMKLQKLAYYAQAWSLVLLEDSLFPEQIQAWKNGPVIPVLWRTLKNDNLPERNQSFSISQEAILRQVWEVYGKLSSTELRKLSHQEMPWLNAYGDKSNGASCHEQVVLEDMSDYYHNFITQEQKDNLQIPPSVVNPKKERTITVTFVDGGSEQVKLSDIEKHLLENAHRVKTGKVQRRCLAYSKRNKRD